MLIIFLGILLLGGIYKKSMAVLPILEYPEPVLRQVAKPIAHIDAATISLANDIISTLRYQTLIDFLLEQSMPRGLAAPQVGVSKRLVVCGIHGRIKVMINPVILERKGAYMDVDDCMSVREKNKTVIKRSSFVKVRFRTLGNKEEILKVKGDYAALVEHEIDHLNGVLNIDY